MSVFIRRLVPRLFLPEADIPPKTTKMRFLSVAGLYPFSTIFSNCPPVPEVVPRFVKTDTLPGTGAAYNKTKKTARDLKSRAIWR